MPVQYGTEHNDSEVDAAVTWLQEVGLAGPTYLFLQSLRPVSFLLGQGLLFLEPLLPLGTWRQAAGRFANLFTDRSRVEDLLVSLETSLRGHRNLQDKENA